MIILLLAVLAILFYSCDPSVGNIGITEVERRIEFHEYIKVPTKEQVAKHKQELDKIALENIEGLNRLRGKWYEWHE